MSTSNSRSRSGSRASTNRDRIRCYKCGEYDHFVKDCPISREERELEQLQEMLNLDDEHSSLKSLVTYIRTGVHYGKIAGWNRMPNIIRYGS